MHFQSQESDKEVTTGLAGWRLTRLDCDDNPLPAVPAFNLEKVLYSYGERSNIMPAPVNQSSELMKIGFHPDAFNSAYCSPT